ncbi:MAG: aspartyl protease family protein, partial [Kangiellaceae bacterium]|nr:aspartyl protease family protein [Kangiellaceae bacterium]
MRFHKLRIVVIILTSILLSVKTSFALNNLEVFKTKSTVDGTQYSQVIPIELRGNKIFLHASINNKSFEFIFDTGSPTVITKRVANELGLKIAGKNVGKDANGNAVEMDLAIVEKLSLGEVNFRNVPVFIFDYTGLPMASCYFDGGVIGSEILPLAKWQIDFDRKQLVITDELNSLKHLKGAKTAELKSFGYPHAPILVHKLNGEFTDHAMFDTGNSELIQLNKLAYEELKKRGLLKKDANQAFGSFGESAGGLGQMTNYSQFELDELTIGSLGLNNVDVWTRPIVPTLIGAKILESHIVTLDFSGSQIFFYPFTKPNLKERTFGFRSYFEDGVFRIGFLSQNSQLAKAGVKVGDQVLRINNHKLGDVSQDKLCSVIESINAATQADNINMTVLHKGE